jgi:glycosyltransferase involved in cell wall biosynthesis
MNSPCFSICIPNFNYGRYIGQTIESVLSQSYQEFEIIVADNASTDDSVEVVDSFKDQRIRLIRNRYNVGFAPNLDRATETAKNEFMILLSSDDLMLPGALAEYARVLVDRGERAKQTVLTSAVDVIDSNGTLTRVDYRPQGSLFYKSLTPVEAVAIAWEKLPLEVHPGHKALAESLRAKNAVAYFLATCHSRELYQNVEGYRSLSRMFPDADFRCKLLAQNPDLVYVPRRLFAYREHNSNQMSSEALSGALKYQVDAYMRTVEFPQAVLDKIGVARQELMDVFIEKAIMERGLQAMAANQLGKAFQCLSFGFATYPGAALRRGKTYALAGLIALGPVGSFIANRLYRWRRPKNACPDS